VLLITAEVAIKTMEEMVGGEDFTLVESDSAKQALWTAKKLTQWVLEKSSNMQLFRQFIDRLLIQFEQCFLPRKSMKAQEERMWRDYHRLRVSDGFKHDWDKFLMLSVHESASPAFYQHVSHRVFRDFVKRKHAFVEASVEASPITIDEENSLRYVAGYICRRVQAKLKSSSLQHKDVMVLFISELSGDEWDEGRGTEEWTNAVDRGGLWHVSDTTYTVFYLMEEEIRKHLIVTTAIGFDKTKRESILESLFKHEDLLFHWSLMSSTLDNTIAMEILKQIATLYLTVRGFAFASSCLELYKQRHKKKTQKSKAIRRKLAVDTT
jgi:hypothetical protein